MFIEIQDPKAGGRIVVNMKNLKFLEYNGYKLERDDGFYKLFCSDTMIYKSKYFTKRIQKFMDDHFEPNQGNLNWEVNIKEGESQNA